MIRSVLVFIFLYCPLLVEATKVSQGFTASNTKTTQVFLQLPANYSLRSKTSDGFMKREQRINNRMVRLDLPTQYLTHNSSGDINLTASFEKWIKEKKLTQYKYSNTKTEHFFPVTLLEDQKSSKTPELYSALHFAAKKDLIQIIPPKKARESFLLNKSTREILQYVNYDKDIFKLKPADPSCIPKNPHDNISDITALSSYPLICSKKPEANGINNLFPNEIYAPAKKACAKNKKSEACSQAIKRCQYKLKQISCERSPWKDIPVAGRLALLNAYGQTYAAELSVNPFTLMCIATRETGTLQPIIRAESSCSAQQTYTASGLFQINRGTIRDYVSRRIIDLSPGAPLADMPNIHHMLEVVLGEELTKKLSAPNNSVGKYMDCPYKSTCREVADKLWDQLGNSVQLQMILAAITVKEKNYNLENYYGSEDSSKNKVYRENIEQCVHCMHEQKVAGLNITPCASLALHGNERLVKEKNLKRNFKNLEKRRIRDEKKLCKDNKTCKK